MVIILAVFLLLILICSKLFVKYTKKDFLALTKNEELDNACINLPENIEICKEILKMFGNTLTKVKLDDDKKSQTSFYNVFNNEIVLADNRLYNKSYTRLLYISHESWHSIQNRKQLKFNTIIGGANILFAIVFAVLMITNVISSDVYMMFFGISLILNLFTIIVRVIIESDATYMSVHIADKYLDNRVQNSIKENIINEYYKLISGGYSTFIFNLIVTNALLIVFELIIMIVKVVLGA